ncbi:MAG: hypothetical protein MK078_03190 [Crocinitomicaceae bacterium]|nr:hypothetical protein [Crocinitomicaceae bacterium]
MDDLLSISPVYWASLILGSATVFTIFWGLDSITHKKLARADITDQEFETHRNILTASFLMEISLVLMFWFQKAMLPFFIAFFITRTVHEFIDELKYHSDRCTPYETRLHLIMWVSVLTKSAGMFIWGYFTGYEGLTELPVIFFIWGGIVLIAMSYISWMEWKR